MKELKTNPDTVQTNPKVSSTGWSPVPSGHRNSGRASATPMIPSGRWWPRGKHSVERWASGTETNWWRPFQKKKVLTNDLINQNQISNETKKSKLSTVKTIQLSRQWCLHSPLVQLHASTSVCMLKNPNRGNHIIVWTPKHPAHTGRNG